MEPLTDDGDAMRLAVKLKVLWKAEVGFFAFIDLDLFQTDQYAATRRAIVRAAAEIGRSM